MRSRHTTNIETLLDFWLFKIDTVSKLLQHFRLADVFARIDSAKKRRGLQGENSTIGTISISLSLNFTANFVNWGLFSIQKVQLLIIDCLFQKGSLKFFLTSTRFRPINVVIGLVSERVVITEKDIRRVPFRIYIMSYGLFDSRV